MTTARHKDPAGVASTMASTDSPTAHAHEHDSCAHCLVDPKASKNSLIAWIVAGVAVLFALLVWFSKSGSFASAAGGFGALGLLAVLACPVTMGGMMWFMMRKSA